jgi:hypothetical protein
MKSDFITRRHSRFALIVRVCGGSFPFRPIHEHAERTRLTHHDAAEAPSGAAMESVWLTPRWDRLGCCPPKPRSRLPAAPVCLRQCLNSRPYRPD